MTKLITNPVIVMIVGGIVLGLGIDMKLAVLWVPGAAILFSGFFMGCVWLATRNP
jgi:hypothetical protein